MYQALSSTRCNSVVCEFVEGVLDGASLVLADLAPCKEALQPVEADLFAGVTAFKTKDWVTGVEHFAEALRGVSGAVSQCGVQQFVVSEANIFGLAKIADKADSTASVVVHGMDFYDELFDLANDIQQHNFRGAGGKMQLVLGQLSAWSGKNMCAGDFCEVVNGIMQALSIEQGSVKQCGADFKEAFGDFTTAYGHFFDSHEHGLHFKHNPPPPSLLCTRITTCYPYRVETDPNFVPG